MTRHAAALGRAHLLICVFLALGLFAGPEAVMVVLKLSHLSELPFPFAPLALFAVQWGLGVVLQVAVVHAGMIEAASHRRAPGLRLVAWSTLWQAICSVALAISMLAGGVLIIVVDSIFHLRLEEQSHVLGGAAIGWGVATLVMARWALAIPALATRDHPGLLAALRRSAQLSRGRRLRLAALQSLLPAVILLMLLATVTLAHTNPGSQIALVYLALLPVTGLLFSFDSLIKVAAYRALGGQEVVEGASAVAAMFE